MPNVGDTNGRWTWNGTRWGCVVSDASPPVNPCPPGVGPWFSPPATYRDIKADFGAVGDGVTNDSAAFTSFNAWAITQADPVYLNIPPGTYAGAGYFYRGIKGFVFFGEGAILL